MFDNSSRGSSTTLSLYQLEIILKMVKIPAYKSYFDVTYALTYMSYKNYRGQFYHLVSAIVKTKVFFLFCLGCPCYISNLIHVQKDYICFFSNAVKTQVTVEAHLSLIIFPIFVAFNMDVWLQFVFQWWMTMVMPLGVAGLQVPNVCPFAMLCHRQISTV